MRRYSFLCVIAILFLSVGPAIAVTFSVEIEPGNSFVHPIDLNTYYKGNTELYLVISMGNNDGWDHTGYSQTHQLFSTNGDGTPVIWIDAGGASQFWDNSEGSIVGMNGWGDYTYFGMTNRITIFSWDGSLPDTMNHTTASMTGWPSGDPLLPRIEFHLTVPTFGSNVPDDIVEICIDQADGSNPTYDWLWPGSVDFGGPYCFKFLTIPSICGDANSDGIVNIIDITFLIEFLYLGGSAPDPIELGDVNSDTLVNILDISYLIAYLYQDGPAPECP